MLLGRGISPGWRWWQIVLQPYFSCGQWEGWTCACRRALLISFGFCEDGGSDLLLSPKCSHQVLNSTTLLSPMFCPKFNLYIYIWMASKWKLLCASFLGSAQSSKNICDELISLKTRCSCGWLLVLTTSEFWGRKKRKKKKKNFTWSTFCFWQIFALWQQNVWDLN